MWTKECTRAFECEKMVLTGAPVLPYPFFDEGYEFIVTTDASATRAGAVLLQLQDEGEKTIAFAGISLMRHRKNIVLLTRSWLRSDSLYNTLKHTCMADIS